MHLVVFPTIPQIGFVIVKHHKPAFVEQPQPLRRQVVVLVDLGQALIQVISGVKNRMRPRHFQPICIGKDLRHFSAHIRIHAVVVGNVQETAGLQVASQVLRFRGREDHIAMAGHVNPRVIKQIGRAHLDSGHFFAQSHGQLIVAKRPQIGHCRGIRVPIAPASVFQHRQLVKAILSGNLLGLNR